jgi:hypothetical protein
MEMRGFENMVTLPPIGTDCLIAFLESKLYPNTNQIRIGLHYFNPFNSLFNRYAMYRLPRSKIATIFFGGVDPLLPMFILWWKFVDVD